MPDIAPWRLEYSERLHDAAARWGLPVLPGRPVVGLPSAADYENGIVGNPYQPNMASTMETVDLWFKPVRCEIVIRLFTFNGRWGFSLDVTDRRPNNYRGYSYGNWISSSDPFTTREGALLGAADRLLELQITEFARDHIAAWRASLTEPVQLDFFSEL